MWAVHAQCGNFGGGAACTHTRTVARGAAPPPPHPGSTACFPKKKASVLLADCGTLGSQGLGTEASHWLVSFSRLVQFSLRHDFGILQISELRWKALIFSSDVCS